MPTKCARTLSAGRPGGRLRPDAGRSQGSVITYDDVTLPPNRLGDQLRAEQYRHFRGETWLEEIVGAPALAGDRK